MFLEQSFLETLMMIILSKSSFRALRKTLMGIRWKILKSENQNGNTLRKIETSSKVKIRIKVQIELRSRMLKLIPRLTSKN